jgi:release factor glutamine methyltransferase
MNKRLSDSATHTVQELLSTVEAAMPDGATSRLDALILVELAFRVDRARLLAELRTPLDALIHEDIPPALARLDGLVARRREGTPIAYLTGGKEFFSRDFAVGPGVLIPRPESEHLVEAALELLLGVPEAIVHDCCCGSGCVGISIAAERAAAGTSTRLLLSDRSSEARRWAALNARAILGTSGHPERPAGRVDWRVVAADLLILDGDDDSGSTGAGGQSHWEPVDVVTANPPYLTTRETAAALAGGWQEPAMALDGGIDGLEPYRRLAGQAYRVLKPGGSVLIEHGSDQAIRVRELLRDAGFRDTETVSDLAGLPRLVRARRDAENR